MESVADIASWLLLLGGSFFLLVGGVGILRMPDVYTRSHAAGITDTLAAILILGGLACQSSFTLVTVKILLILLFLLFTGPTASHALNHTAWECGLKPLLHSPSPVKQPNVGEPDG